MGLERIVGTAAAHDDAVFPGKGVEESTRVTRKGRGITPGNQRAVALIDHAHFYRIEIIGGEKSVGAAHVDERVAFHRKRAPAQASAGQNGCGLSPAVGVGIVKQSIPGVAAHDINQAILIGHGFGVGDAVGCHCDL